MSDAIPTPLDVQLIEPVSESFRDGAIDRGGYWHESQRLLRDAHPYYSEHDVTRVARILAPFPLRDDRYAPR